MIERDDIDFERETSDLLSFDPDDRPNAMRGIDDMIANREIQCALVH
jgi:hypothetical protein